MYSIRPRSFLVSPKIAGIAVKVVAVLLLLCLFLLAAGCGGDKTGKASNDIESGIEENDIEDSQSSDTGEEVDDNQAGPVAGDSDFDIKAAEREAVSYASGMNENLGDLTIVSSALVDEWARVDLEPVDRSAERATVLLNCKGGKWEVVGFGFIVPEDYPEAPAELFK